MVGFATSCKPVGHTRRSSHAGRTATDPEVTEPRADLSGTLEAEGHRELFRSIPLFPGYLRGYRRVWGDRPVEMVFSGAQGGIDGVGRCSGSPPGGGVHILGRSHSGAVSTRFVALLAFWCVCWPDGRLSPPADCLFADFALLVC